MTIQEAIKLLKNKIIDATGLLGSLPNSARITSYLSNEIKAFEMAIEALEKQLPKKPTDGSFVWDEWLCPNCESRYEDDYDYCPNCGQALDWSE